MKIKKINKFEKIELLSYKEILKNGLSKEKKGRIIFNDLGLKNVITGLATIELSRIKTDNYEGLLKVFNVISKPIATRSLSSALFIEERVNSIILFSLSLFKTISSS